MRVRSKNSYELSWDKGQYTAHCLLILMLSFPSDGERLLLSRERCWDSWPPQEKNSMEPGTRLAQTFAIIKFCRNKGGRLLT